MTQRRKTNRLMPLKAIATVDDRPPDVPFTLTCAWCDSDGPMTFQEAILSGWTEIDYDPTGISWNFLGVCEECLKNVGPRAVAEKPKRK